MTEEALFHAALAVPAADRAAFLDANCPDPELRRRVEALLTAHDRSGPVDPPIVTGDYASAPPPVAVGTTFAGRYKLRELLGEGGMGTVYVADQTEPMQRRVAIKVIRTGLDSAGLLARFEQERQAVAVMDHPNIAKVFDAGVAGVPGEAGSGVPFFAMELVKGVPITRYCDDARLTPRQRLELFVPVCQAVQHAHQKGIIHRDLKPSNVLVGLYDGKPVPKVIDFGVAKATGPKLTEHSVYTAVGTLVGTLEYMAPEQAELNNLDIDTRADIYALGVILYELLTGAVPFSRRDLQAAGFAEMVRVLKEVEPAKPSTKLSGSGTLPSVAAARGLDPRALTRQVRGELDWIAMKCLEKERSRRYETANQLALEVQRYLADEPVLAGPPSVAYRVRKFVRRNRGAVVAASLVLLTLVGGIVGTTIGLVWAHEAREAEAVQKRLAQASEQKAIAAAAAESTAKETAQAQEAETKAVLEFVQNKVFAAARPKGQDGGLGYDVKLADAVKAALPFVDTSFRDQPLTQARLRATLGSSFLFLGDAKLAAEQFQAARALYTVHRSSDDPVTLKIMNNLANSYEALGRLADALKVREETLALMKAKLGPDHPDTFMTMGNLGNSYDGLGRHADALKVREETLALRKAKLGPDHPDTLSSMNTLAISYAVLGRNADALKLNEETLAAMKARLGPDHPATLRTMNNLAINYRALGRDADALKLSEETLMLRKAKLGPDHPDTLSSMRNLALGYLALGRDADALKLSEETLALQTAKLGPDHPETLMTMGNLAISYNKLGRYADAVKLREETVALMRTKLGPDHQNTLMSMNNLASSYSALGRYAESLKLQEETLSLQEAKLGPNHPNTLMSMANVAVGLVNLDRSAEAVPFIDDFVRRAAGQVVDPGMVPTLMDLRLRHFEKSKDAAGCRQTADMWEALHRTAAASLYQAAVMRAVTAAVARQTPSADATRLAAAEADRAITWLRQAVAAGYRDVPHMLKDPDLAAVRGRADFADLLWDLADAGK